MKLYIPTCTLNFNNIFSTESISPASFYSKRGFGNKRYVKVEANDLDNVIVLYSKYPHYHVISGDLENSALVLEIDTEDYSENKFQKVNERDGIEVFVTNSTIYLNPFHVKVYFNSWQEKQSALTKAEQSLENKYSKLYGHAFVVRQEKTWSFTSLLTSKDYFDWTPEFYGSAPNIELTWTEDDAVIDRIKGAITCYLIGANMSVSKDVSRLKQLARKMRNTLSSIVNSPDKKPTDIQDETLLSYIKEFNQIYAQIDENSKYNNTIIDQKLISPSTGLDKETIVKLLKDLHLFDDFKRKLYLRPIYDANELYSCLDSTTMSPADAYTVVIEHLFSAIRRIENKEQEKKQKNDLSELIIVTNKQITIIDPLSGKGTYYNRLLNSLINSEYKEFMSANGTEELLSIAFVGGGKLKDYLPNDWEGSEYQTYINGLLANMQQGKSFDLFSIDNSILQSFAAFCQKGEEVDRLTDYMLQCGFSDYRFALGIYGATRGFASLPKTFTTSLFDGDKSYITVFYKTLYKWLFDIELKNLFFSQPVQSAYIDNCDKTISSKIMKNLDRIEPKLEKREEIVNAVSQAASLEDAVQSPRAFMYILDSLPNITRTSAYKNLKKAEFENDTTIYTPETFKERIYTIIGSKALKPQKQNVDTAIELEAKRQDPVAFLYILDNFMEKNSSAYKRIAKLLENQEIVSHHKEATLFDEMGTELPSSSIRQTTSSLSKEYLPKLPSLNQLSSEVNMRLEQNWRFTGQNYKNDDREHIRYFLNLCKKEGRGDSPMKTSLYEVFTVQLAEQIEKELLSFYGL